MKVVAVIPAFNEATVIAQVVSQVKSKVAEVIVVDDGSADTTGYVAQSAGATVARHFLNRGQGAALQTGIALALRHEADIIVTFDADGQHVAEEIDAVIAPLLLGAVDVVLGSRFLNKTNTIPFWRIQLLKIATRFTAFYTGLTVTDAHNGFRALSAKAAKLITITQDGMAHASEIIEEIKRHDLRFTEVGVTINYTYYSLEKGQKLTNSLRIVWELLLSRISKWLLRFLLFYL